MRTEGGRCGFCAGEWMSIECVNRESSRDRGCYADCADGEPAGRGRASFLASSSPPPLLNSPEHPLAVPHVNPLEAA